MLDLGCGVGDDVRSLAEIVGPGGRVTGIDNNAALIDEARARGVPPNADFVVASADALPCGDAAFDAVRAERVFQHLHDPARAAREVRRVLREGGSAFLLDQDWETLAIAGADRAATRRIVQALADRFANGWAGRNARALLRRAGFTTIEIAPMLASPAFALAYELIIEPALEGAVRESVIDADEGKRWLLSLVAAEQAGEFFCSVTVIAALAR